MNAQLIQTIRRVQDEISKHFADFRNNEAQTILSLVNPILDALGWQTSNPRQVRREFALGRRRTRVDMALLQRQKPVVFLEAKALNTRLTVNQIEQIGQYCFQKGVPNAILTNGEEWHIYRPQLTSLPFAERKLFIAQLGQDERSAESAATELSKLARENIDQLEDEAWHMLLEKYWEKDGAAVLLPIFAKNLRQAIAKEHNKPIREVPPTAVRALLNEKLGLRGEEETKPKPRPEPKPQPKPEPETSPAPAPGPAIVLAGQQIPLKYHYQILIEVANWLIKKGLLQQEDCPLHMSGKSRRFLIHTRPRHERMGKPFRAAKRLENGLHIEAHLPTEHIIQYANELLERYGLPAETLSIAGEKTRKPNQRPKSKKTETSHTRRTPAVPSAQSTLVLDKERFEFKAALDIPQIIARWLIKRGQLSQTDCPLRVGKMGQDRCFINTAPKHPDGTPFWQPRELPNQLFMECLASKKQSISRARQLLQHFGYAPDTLQFSNFNE